MGLAERSRPGSKDRSAEGHARVTAASHSRDSDVVETRSRRRWRCESRPSHFRVISESFPSHFRVISESSSLAPHCENACFRTAPAPAEQHTPFLVFARKQAFSKAGVFENRRFRTAFLAFAPLSCLIPGQALVRSATLTAGQSFDPLDRCDPIVQRSNFDPFDRFGPITTGQPLSRLITLTRFSNGQFLTTL